MNQPDCKNCGGSGVINKYQFDPNNPTIKFEEKHLEVIDCPDCTGKEPQPQSMEEVKKEWIEKTYNEMCKVIHSNNLDITPQASKQLYRDMEHWKNNLINNQS